MEQIENRSTDERSLSCLEEERNIVRLKMGALEELCFALQNYISTSEELKMGNKTASDLLNWGSLLYAEYETEDDNLTGVINKKEGLN